MNKSTPYNYAIIAGIAIVSTLVFFVPFVFATDNSKSLEVPLVNPTKEELLGKIDPATNKSFILVPKEYTSKTKLFVREETFDAFAKMYEAAKKDGVKLSIVSGTRTFYDQKRIWETKWNAPVRINNKTLSLEKKNDTKRAEFILKYSSMPGTSRHHWGTDIDINSVEPQYFLTKEGKLVYTWLQENAARYGFCQTYNKKGLERSSGYEEEKWHWSYMPLSSDFLDQYKKNITASDITGFKGAYTAKTIKVLGLYVGAISSQCANFVMQQVDQ